ncbi:MAG TPA: hypothetical protein VJ203_05265 [Bacteroidales bacterium]|nr:hypothetical protein [Bacteroidales bacterium]
MRKLYHIIIAVALVFTACENDDNTTDPYSEVTVSMEANSASDVYYSFATGEVNKVPRSDWDIAFSVPLQSATILINEGAGVELYCVGDTNAWESVDENTIEGLEPRYNNKSDWSTGAFNLNASGFPNYGWGTYHQSTDHNVGGDSIYVIKLADGDFKKLMIRVKLGATSSNVIRWADLTGNNETVENFSTTPYFDAKHFIHYSLVNNEIVEAEPGMDEWDLLFTRYVVRIPAGPGVFMNYPVMGVLGNPDVTIARVTGIPPEKATESDFTGGYSDAADVIGFDWKVSDPVTHEVSLADSTSYFVESVDGKKYQLYFTNYGGNAAGTVSFKVKTLE